MWREALKESLDPTCEFPDESATLAFNRLALLQSLWDRAELLLVPIWCSEHWTLLALWKKPEGVEISYVDTLANPSGRCGVLAEQVLERPITIRQELRI